MPVDEREPATTELFSEDNPLDFSIVPTDDDSAVVEVIPQTFKPQPTILLFGWDDIGMADRVNHWAGHTLRYDTARETVYRFATTHWITGTDDHALNVVEDIVRNGLPREVALYPNDEFTPEEEARAKAAKRPARSKRELALLFADSYRATPKIGHALKAWKHSRGSWVVAAEEFDQDGWKFNCLNGLLDLRTGELAPHTPEQMCSQLADVAFDAEATCPNFDRFLALIQPDPEHRALLLRLFGISLVGEILDQVVTLHLGYSGSNGKGVLMELRRRIFGTYARVLDRATVLEGRGNRSDIARTDGSRANYVDEVGSGKLNAEVIKMVTGGGKITVTPLYQNSREIEVRFSLDLVSNSMPQLPVDKSILRRLVLLDYPTTVTGEQWDTFRDEQDHVVPDFLYREASGILNRFLEGLKDHQENGGLRVPDDLIAGARTQLEDQDPFLTFLQQRSVLREPTEQPYELSAARQLYVTWFEREGYEGTPESTMRLRHKAQEGRYAEFIPEIRQDSRKRWQLHGVGFPPASELN